jgi:hypothetical protein
MKVDLEKQRDGKVTGLVEISRVELFEAFSNEAAQTINLELQFSLILYANRR